MLVEVESKSIAKSDLKEIIVQTFFGDSHLFGSFLQRIFFSLPGLIASSRIILSPFDNFFNNVSDSSLFGSSALLFAFSRNMRLLIFAYFFFLVLNVVDCSLSIHQSIDMQQSKVFRLNVEECIQTYLFEVNGDILPDWKYSTSNKYLSLR